MYATHQKGLSQIFGNVRCPILSNSTLQCWCGPEPYMALVRPRERYIEEKQSELETKNK